MSKLAFQVTSNLCLTRLLQDQVYTLGRACRYLVLRDRNVRPSPSTIGKTHSIVVGTDDCYDVDDQHLYISRERVAMWPAHYCQQALRQADPRQFLSW